MPHDGSTKTKYAITDSRGDEYKIVADGFSIDDDLLTLLDGDECVGVFARGCWISIYKSAL